VAALRYVWHRTDTYIRWHRKALCCCNEKEAREYGTMGGIGEEVHKERETGSKEERRTKVQQRNKDERNKRNRRKE